MRSMRFGKHLTQICQVRRSIQQPPMSLWQKSWRKTENADIRSLRMLTTDKLWWHRRHQQTKLLTTVSIITLTSLWENAYTLYMSRTFAVGMRAGTLLVICRVYTHYEYFPKKLREVAANRYVTWNCQGVLSTRSRQAYNGWWALCKAYLGEAA